MNWEAILNGAIGAGVISIIIKLIDVYFTRGKTKSETVVNYAEYVKRIAEGGTVAVEALTEALKEYDRRNDEQAEELKELRHRADELEAGREERTRLIQQLERRIETDLLETQTLKNEVLLLRRQVAEGEQKLFNYKQAVELLVAALREADVPMPKELELLLGDSIHGLRWPKQP